MWSIAQTLLLLHSGRNRVEESLDAPGTRSVCRASGFVQTPQDSGIHSDEMSVLLTSAPLPWCAAFQSATSPFTAEWIGTNPLLIWRQGGTSARMVSVPARNLASKLC